jgi:hypothetical protein
MDGGRWPDPPPGWETQGPRHAASNRRPRWALPALILGLLIALWILGLDVDFVLSTWADPSRRVVRTMVLGYVLPLMVPLSAILLIPGGLGVMRPATAKRPRLRLVWIGGVLIFAVSAFTVPWLITSPT